MDFQESYREKKKERRRKVLIVSLFLLFIFVGWMMSSKMGDIKGSLAGIGNALSFLNSEEKDLFPPESKIDASDIKFEEMIEESAEQEKEPVLISKDQRDQREQENEAESDQTLSSREKQINQMKNKINILKQEIGEMRSELNQMQRKADSLQQRIEQLR